MLPRFFARLLALVLAPAWLTAADAATQTLPRPWLPLDPGAVRCEAGPDGAFLRNGALRFTVAVQAGGLVPTALDNGFTARAHPLAGDLFAVLPRGGQWLPARRFRLDGPLACRPVAANPVAARAAERRPGAALEAHLSESGTGLKVEWRAVLRDDANYVRENVRLDTARDLDLARVALIELDLADATVAGTTAGSPIVADDRFFGFAHPMAESLVLGGGANAAATAAASAGGAAAGAATSHASAFVRRALPLRANVPVDYAAVLGVAPAGQMRRGFAAFLEDERAAPFRTFLHYNSWFDIGYFTPYTEKEAVDVIHAYEAKLVRTRGVTLDSFLFDDGWDDHAHLWQFNTGFPHGFAAVRDAAAAAGAAPGMWLSPWGGYGPPRDERLAAARAAGYEVDSQGLALSGPKYYALFHDTTLDLLRRYGINQFKLDGTGSPDKVTPGSAFDSDFAAAIALIGDLRAVRPDLFVNLTTGTWASPFWLLTADSIWRDGDDTGFAGTGSDRQRWITYRDAYSYGGVVRLGPLFPLNSVMLHGIVYARHAKGLDTDPNHDFADEVWSYFASGTGLQELYVSPGLLSEGDWDTLAAAAKWARARAATLRDAHWIGGDPARGEVYGWAAWSPTGAVLAVRNPGDRPQSIVLDPGIALEAPAGTAVAWRARAVHGAANAPATLQAGQPVRIELAPYAVQVWDLAPVAGR
jgi:hypothetical protein